MSPYVLLLCLLYKMRALKKIKFIDVFLLDVFYSLNVIEYEVLLVDKKSKKLVLLL